MNFELITIFFLYAKLSSVADIISKFNKKDKGSGKKCFEPTTSKETERKMNENICIGTTESNFYTQREKHLDTNIPLKVEQDVGKSYLNVLAINKEIVNSIAELKGENASYSCQLDKQLSSNSLKKVNDTNRLPVVVKLIKKESLTMERAKVSEELNESINLLMNCVGRLEDKNPQTNEPMVDDKKLNHDEPIDQKDNKVDQVVTERTFLQEENANSQHISKKDLEELNELLEALRQPEEITATEKISLAQENINLSADVERNLEELDLHAEELFELGNQTNFETEFSAQQIISLSDAQNTHVVFPSNDNLRRCISKKSIDASSYQGETSLSMFGSGVVIHSNFAEETSKGEIANTDVKRNYKTSKKKKANTFCLPCVSGNISDDPDDEEKKLYAKKQLVY